MNRTTPNLCDTIHEIRSSTLEFITTHSTRRLLKPYKFLRSGIKKPDQVSIEDYEAEFKLSGWTFEDADAFGVSNEYFKGINANGSVRGGAYVFETVQYKLTQIINEIKENIINGVLDSNEIQLNQEPKLDLKKEIDTDEFEI